MQSYNSFKDGYVADYASATTIYHGFYKIRNDENGEAIAVATSAALFKIAEETRDGSGNTTSMKWVSNSYNQIWDNRAALTYV